MSDPAAKGREVRFTLPPELLDSLGERDEELSAHALEAFLVDLFREGKITSGYGARVLGVDRRDFLELLARRKVPLVEYEEGELEAEVEAAERFLKAR